MFNTIKEACLWASSYLKENNIENPYLEGQLLLKYLLGTTLTYLRINDDKTLTTEEKAKYRIWVEKRGSKTPFAYIINEKEFMGLNLYVDERVLIPRPDTETLVEWALSYLEIQECLSTVADIGTGSGAIALSIAKFGNVEMVYSIDLSEKSLEVCAINRQKHQLDQKVTLLQGDLLIPLKKEGLKVDLILANLPYIPENQFNSLQIDVKEYEPYDALIGGSTGLEIYDKLLDQLGGTLKENGAIAIEIAFDQGTMAMNMLKQRGFLKTYILRDLSGQPRVVVGEGYLT